MEKFPKFSHFFYQSTKCCYLTDTTHFTMMQARLVLMPVPNVPTVFYCAYRKKKLDETPTLNIYLTNQIITYQSNFVNGNDSLLNCVVLLTADT